MSETGERMVFTVNGRERDVVASPARPLLDVLREDLGLTGTKEGCSVGVCGACSVLVDGQLMSSCLVPLGMVSERDVTTVEGLAAEDGSLSAVQQSFLECGGSSAASARPARWWPPPRCSRSAPHRPPSRSASG